MSGPPLLPARRLVVKVSFDPVQAIWLDAIADINAATRAAVLRLALRHLVALESTRVQRTRHYALLREIARAERWDPVQDYITRHHRAHGVSSGAPDRPAQRTSSQATPRRPR